MADSSSTQHLQDAFNKYDTNKSGKISKDELINVFKTLNMEIDDRTLQLYMNSMDPQKTGEIEFAGFRRFMENDLFVQQSPDDLHALFAQFDKDKSGFITINELKKGMAKRGLRFTKAEIKAQIAKLDENNDKKLSYDEFIKLFSHKNNA